jgi:hypothetical protein
MQHGIIGRPAAPKIHSVSTRRPAKPTLYAVRVNSTALNLLRKPRHVQTRAGISLTGPGISVARKIKTRFISTILFGLGVRIPAILAAVNI